MRFHKIKETAFLKCCFAGLVLLLSMSNYSFNQDYADWNPTLTLQNDEEGFNPHDFSLSDEFNLPLIAEETPQNPNIMFPIDTPYGFDELSEDLPGNQPIGIPNSDSNIIPNGFKQSIPANTQQKPTPESHVQIPTGQSNLRIQTTTPTSATTTQPTPPPAQSQPIDAQTPTRTAIPQVTTIPNPTQAANEGQSQATNPNEPPRTILINFNNVNIIEFIRFISRASNRNFIFDDQDLNFNVTIVSEEPATIENVMSALMQVLRVHDLSLIEQGNNILIHRNKTVTNISQVIAEGLPELSGGQQNELITQVFRLNILDAEKAATIIQPLISEGALVESMKDTNQVIVTDIASNVSKIGQLLKSMDAPNSGMIIGQYVVVNALLDSLVSLAERVMEPIAEGRPIVFVPHTASNSVFVVSSSFLVDRSLAVLRNLDINIGTTRIFSGDNLRFSGLSQEFQKGGVDANGVPLEPLIAGALESSSPWSTDLPVGHIERTKFYIHKLRYRIGDQIVDALGRVGVSLQEMGTSNMDLISTIQSIQWLEGSNSLVFTGTINAVAKVKELIDEIDTPLRQVFIEMLIMQMTLDETLDYSVNFGSRFNNRNNVAGSQAFLSGANSLAAALDTGATVGASLDPSGLARTQGYHLGIIGRSLSRDGVSYDTIGALVTAFHDKDKINILMNPKLLVEDNSTAEVFVGVNTAFQISSITNDRGEIITNNFEFRDVGTLFRVTPLISNNDIVTLEIREEVSSIASTPQVTNSLSSISPGPTTNISRTVTRVHVPDKYFLVMSGMISDQYERRRQQVPCLGGVPVLGALFSDKHLNEQKRNLMIFIRPQIIDSVDDIDFITRHEQDIYRNKNRTKKMWKYEVEEALDLLNIRCPDVSLHDSEQFNP